MIVVFNKILCQNKRFFKDLFSWCETNPSNVSCLQPNSWTLKWKLLLHTQYYVNKQKIKFYSASFTIDFSSFVLLVFLVLSLKDCRMFFINNFGLMSNSPTYCTTKRYICKEEYMKYIDMVGDIINLS